jgi:hypothetical protein
MEPKWKHRAQNPGHEEKPGAYIQRRGPYWHVR